MIEGAAIGLGNALARQNRANARTKAAYAPKQELIMPPGVTRPTNREVAVINEAVGRASGVAVSDVVKYTPTQIDGAMLMDVIVRGLREYMRFEREDYALMIAAWIAHTHFVSEEGKLLLPFSPRLMVMADPSSGKTRLLEILKRLVFQGIGPVSGDVTGPGVRNALEKHHTVLLDEVHLYISTRGIKSYANQYTPEGGSLNGIDGINSQATYGPMAMAGIREKLEDSRLYERVMFDLLTRCITVYLKKKKKDKLDPLPKLDEAFIKSATDAGKALSFWGAQCRPDDPDKKLWPLWDLPEELESRNWDMAAAMCAVADRAIDNREQVAESEVTGKHGTTDRMIPMPDEYRYRWPRMMRKACVNVLTNAGDVEEVTANLGSLFR